MGSKYQEFTDDVLGVAVSNNTADDHPDEKTSASSSSAAAAAVANAMIAARSINDVETSVGGLPVSISASNQPIIIVQAPRLQRSFERYPSKAAVIFGAIQVYM